MHTRRSPSRSTVDEAKPPRVKKLNQLNRREKALMQALGDTGVGDFMARRRIVIELHVVREEIQAVWAK